LDSELFTEFTQNAENELRCAAHEQRPRIPSSGGAKKSPEPTVGGLKKEDGGGISIDSALGIVPAFDSDPPFPSSCTLLVIGLDFPFFPCEGDLVDLVGVLLGRTAGDFIDSTKAP
jgi:hypothetical protein